MGDVVGIVARVGDREMKFEGRQAWALHKLATAGDNGVTPIEAPGPRWSDYVFKLRRCGVGVETIDERHSGSFPGDHARYRLTIPVEIIETETRP